MTDDDGIVTRIKKAVDSINPFKVVGEKIKPSEKKDPNALMKGRSSEVFAENVRKLRSQGHSEAEATKRAQRFMMEQ